MFLSLLCVTIAVILVVHLVTYRADLSSPALLNAIIWLIISVAALMNIGYWNYDMSFKGFFIVVFGILAFSVGVHVASLFVSGKYSAGYYQHMEEFEEFRIERFLISFSIIGYILLRLLIKEKELILKSMGYSLRSSNFLLYLRHKEALGYTGGTNSMIQVLNLVYTGVSFVLINIMIYLVINKKIKIRSKIFAVFFISQIPVMGFEFLSSGRDGFIRYFTIIFISLLCFLRKKYVKVRVFFSKGFRSGVIVFVVLIGIFVFSGMFREGSSRSVWNLISSYMASGLLAFDYAINSNDFRFSTPGSYRTLWGWYSFINRFTGAETSAGRADTYVYISDTLKTNVYTGFYDYYTDFGIVGLLILELIFGFFMGVIYYKTYTKKNFFWIIIFSFYSYMIIRQITEAYFIRYFFTVTHIVIAFSLILAAKYLPKLFYKRS